MYKKQYIQLKSPMYNYKILYKLASCIITAMKLMDNLFEVSIVKS